MLKEFKEFALRGSVIDLAVGVIIGGAFSKIVSSLVSEIIMPLVSLVTGRINFNNMFICLAKVPDGKTADTIEQAKALNIPTLNYGAFITQVMDFILMAFIIFLMVKFINRISSITRKNEQKIEEDTTKKCPYCKTEIDVEATRCPHCTSKLEEPVLTKKEEYDV